MPRSLEQAEALTILRRHVRRLLVGFRGSADGDWLPRALSRAVLRQRRRRLALPRPLARPLARGVPRQRQGEAGGDDAC